MTFETDHFSYYMVGQSSDFEDPSYEKSSNMNLYLVLGAIALVAAAGIVVTLIRSRH